MKYLLHLTILKSKRKIFCEALLLSALLHFNYSFSQCTVFPNAVQGISYTYILTDGTNASGVAYNPDFNIYYAVIAGNSGFPYETFDPSGTSLYQTNAGFDFRGLWWNPNTGQVEGNGYFDLGLWTSDLDANGYALNTGNIIFIGQNQPDPQSCGDYDYDADEILYYYNGSVYRYNRTTNVFLGSYALTGFPVPISNINITSVAFTGCLGNEIALEDWINKTILLFNKSTGAYSTTSQLPATAVTNDSYRFSYANNMVWLYDVSTRTWTSYSILCTTPGGNAINLGNDTVLCTGSSLVLSAGSSTFDYLWSTGTTDSTITIDTAGIYWLTVTDGSCMASDTIEIFDTICTPLVAFNSTDTNICEKFCVSYFDSSLNNPTAWQWIFEGGSPAISADQDPGSICYNNAGTYDVTLITTSATGMDTLFLPDYITVSPTPPLPVITQIGYELTSSVATAYQWQFNSVDIPGATNQSYTAMQTGLYTVTIYDENGCKSSASLSVTIVGIAGFSDELQLSIFPNPNKGAFLIQLSNVHQGDEISLSLENSIGQLVFLFKDKIQAPEWKKEIGLTDIPTGVYFLQISIGEICAQKKVIVSE